MKPILAFTGSNNPHSINQQLLLAAAQKFPVGYVRFLSLTDFPVPIYSPCLEKQMPIPVVIRQLQQLFDQADGFMIASPEHNGLPTALLKNTIDWLSRLDQRIFQGKPVLLLSTSPGQTGGASSLNILAGLLPRWGGTLAASYSLPSFNRNYDATSQRILNPAEDENLTLAVSRFLQAVSPQLPLPISA
jgi:NAD(P)H-dependent FMN reductase